MKVENGLVTVNGNTYIFADTIYKMSNEKFIGVSTTTQEPSHPIMRYIVSPISELESVCLSNWFLLAECSPVEISKADREALDEGKYKKYFYSVSSFNGSAIQVRDRNHLLLNEDYDTDLHPVANS